MFVASVGAASSPASSLTPAPLPIPSPSVFDETEMWNQDWATFSDSARIVTGSSVVDIDSIHWRSYLPPAAEREAGWAIFNNVRPACWKLCESDLTADSRRCFLNNCQQLHRQSRSTAFSGSEGVDLVFKDLCVFVVNQLFNSFLITVWTSTRIISFVVFNLI